LRPRAPACLSLLGGVCCDASGLDLGLVVAADGRHGRLAVGLERGDAALADEVEDRGDEEDGRDDDGDDDGEGCACCTLGTGGTAAGGRHGAAYGTAICAPVRGV